MSDTKAGEPKKRLERKKHLQIVNMLKKSIGVTTITKGILDLEINLTVKELLASALTIKRQLTMAITEDKAVQFWVNILESSSINI